MSASGPSQYWSVVAAAGSGTRMRATRAKPYLPVGGRALIEHGVEALLKAAWIRGVVVVLAPGDRTFDGLALARQPRLHTATGGATRADSVLAGLRRVAELAGAGADAAFVLVHDAARPCVAGADLERLRDQASDDDGGLLAVPVTDTLKRAESGRAAATVERSDLWRAQTPQLFRLGLLRAALEHCLAEGVEVTDEARAMEAAGHRPRLVGGQESNVKVTYPEDLALAEFWLERRDT